MIKNSSLFCFCIFFNLPFCISEAAGQIDLKVVYFALNQFLLSPHSGWRLHLFCIPWCKCEQQWLFIQFSSKCCCRAHTDVCSYSLSLHTHGLFFRSEYRSVTWFVFPTRLKAHQPPVLHPQLQCLISPIWSERRWGWNVLVWKIYLTDKLRLHKWSNVLHFRGNQRKVQWRRAMWRRWSRMVKRTPCSRLTPTGFTKPTEILTDALTVWKWKGELSCFLRSS